MVINSLDKALSLAALFILAPFLAVCALTLRFTGEGKVFYRQQRIGFEARPFYLLKFATMLENSPNMLTGSITTKNDPRVLPFGKVLRKTKINELPQLINIFKGEMSFVGPRPLTQENFSMYHASQKLEIARNRPGLTGIGSIVFRDEEMLLDVDDPVSFYKDVIAPYKGELEMWYAANKGLGLYLSIIAVTILAVATSKRGIVWKCFTDLPKPPKSIAEGIGYLT